MCVCRYVEGVVKLLEDCVLLSESPGVNDVNYTFVGTSNATQCLEYVGQLFDNSTYDDTQYVCRNYVTSYKPKGYFYVSFPFLHTALEPV